MPVIVSAQQDCNLGHRLPPVPCHLTGAPTCRPARGPHAGHTLLYEVLGLNSAPDAAKLRQAAEQTEKMVKDLWDMKFDQVLSEATEFLTSSPDDGAVKFLQVSSKALSSLVRCSH
eukprot:SAG22_NODE_1245_length_5020_cov_1.424304_2_plen_116_part_00